MTSAIHPYCSPYIYVGHTTIIAKGKDPVEISDQLNQIAHNLDDWFKWNRLSCNVHKTKCMMLSNSRFRNKDLPLSVEIHDQLIEEVPHFKYSGLNVDRHLNFEVHAEKVAKKVNSCAAAQW